MRPGTAIATAIAGAALGAAPLSAASPALVRLEPVRIEAGRSVTLLLVGSGFDPAVRVYLESARAGRFVALAPSQVSPDRCVVELPFGLAAEPDRRAIYLENPDGERTRTLELSIGGSAREDDRAPPPVEADDAEPESVPAGPGARQGSTRPEISALRPEELAAGAPDILEILGSGFADGARVEVTVNLNAGSTRLPEYGPKSFPAERYGEELLEVSFDRGFHRTPGIRDVVVVNPDGARSAPYSLRIRQQERSP